MNIKINNMKFKLNTARKKFNHFTLIVLNELKECARAIHAVKSNQW